MMELKTLIDIAKSIENDDSYKQPILTNCNDYWEIVDCDETVIDTSKYRYAVFNSVYIKENYGDAI